MHKLVEFFIIGILLLFIRVPKNKKRFSYATLEHCKALVEARKRFKQTQDDITNYFKPRADLTK